MKNDAIIIYAKWPELNKTKTRIAEETTPEFARDISMACLDDVVSHIAFSPEYDVYFGVNTEQELYNFTVWIAQSPAKLKEEAVKAIEKFFKTNLVKLQ